MTGTERCVSKLLNSRFRKGEVSRLQRRVSIRPRFYIFIIMLMILCFAASFIVAQVHYSRVARQVNSLTLERLGLTARINQLSAQLNYVRTDDYIERVARDELNMIMPGEIRYVSN